ncbi:MAG: hypothetical protein KDE19_18795 [Caldilineaceae bacterium]|nr:hypothetical protein [Caldilineaceae bacterium]
MYPNTLLAIKAEKNRQQFSFYVDDIALTVHQVVENGGSQLQEIAETNAGKTCGVADPDGNSIELTEQV